jgi:hypothetical protein
MAWPVLCRSFSGRQEHPSLSGVSCLRLEGGGPGGARWLSDHPTEKGSATPRIIVTTGQDRGTHENVPVLLDEHAIGLLEL